VAGAKKSSAKYLRGSGRNRYPGARWWGAQRKPRGGGTWARCLQVHESRGQGTVLRPSGDQTGQRTRSGPGEPGRAKGWAETCVLSLCGYMLRGLALPERLWAGMSCVILGLGLMIRGPTSSLAVRKGYSITRLAQTLWTRLSHSSTTSTRRAMGNGNGGEQVSETKRFIFGHQIFESNRSLVSFR
jgi:hypothetical protein